MAGFFLPQSLKCFLCLPAGRGAEAEPAGDHAAEIPAARGGERHAGRG